MICPACNAEYRAGFTRCVDCDVELVRELPKGAIEKRGSAGEPGDPNEDPFCSFWKGEDPRVHAELCQLLEEAGIPHNTVHRGEHLFNFRNFPAFEVGVPFSLYQKAELAVKEAYGTEEVEDVGSGELQTRLIEGSRIPHQLPEVAASPAGNTSHAPRAAEKEGGVTAPLQTEWCPEDAATKVWASSGEAELGDFLVAALHENGIQCRLENNGREDELYVSPGDESRAREIIREVVEGQPPE